MDPAHSISRDRRRLHSWAASCLFAVTLHGIATLGCWGQEPMDGAGVEALDANAGPAGRPPADSPAASLGRRSSADLLTLLRQFGAASQEFEIDPAGRQHAVRLVGNAWAQLDRFRVEADAVAATLDPATGPDQELGLRLVAVGNVLITQGAQSFRAGTAFYDHVARQLVLTEAILRVDLALLENRPSGFAGTALRGTRDLRLQVPDPNDVDLAEGAPSSDAWSESSAAAPWAAVAGSVREVGPLLEPGRLVLAARTLRLEDFAHFVAQGLVVTTCEYVDPHWAILAERVTGVAEPAPPAPDATAAVPAPRADPRLPHYRLALERTRLLAWGWSLPLLPRMRWNTAHVDSLPLRSMHYERSSRFGHRIDSLWNGNLLVPEAVRAPLDLDLGLRLDYLSERGTGTGAELEHGRRPARWDAAPGHGRGPFGLDLYGAGILYAIHDRGVDANDQVPETERRHRARLHERLRLPTGTWIDLELATESDRGFLEEYFKSEARNEKEPENLLYVRQPVGELGAVTVLAKRRLVSYRSEVERQPELSVFVIERPLGRTGIDLDLVGRAARLDFEADRALGAVPEQSTDRADLRATLARAFGTSRWGKVRPFIEGRGTVWDEDPTGDGTLERLQAATGARVGWHLARVFPVRWGGYEALRHVIDPELSYRLVFENNVDPNVLFVYDEVEEADRFEVLTLALRTHLFGRRVLPIRAGAQPDTRLGGRHASGAAIVSAEQGGAVEVRDDRRTRIRQLLEASLEVDYFPRPGRDNSRDPWGPIRGETILSPASWLTYYVDGAYDVEDGPRFSEFNQGVRVRGNRTWVGLGTRYRQHSRRTITASLEWRPDSRYSFEAFYDFDFRRNKAVEQIYTVARDFHRWTALFTVGIDEGDDNVSFTVRFGPRELWDSVRERGRLRSSGSERGTW